MQLDLTDEEAAALLSPVTDAIEDVRYRSSPRIRTLRGILSNLRRSVGARCRRSVILGDEPTPGAMPKEQMVPALKAMPTYHFGNARLDPVCATRSTVPSRSPRCQASSAGRAVNSCRLRAQLISVPMGFVAARKQPYVQAAWWQELLASN